MPALLAVAVGALLLGSVSAPAATQRAHEFSFAFGSEGSGEGQFVHPSGVAVNSSTGDVYVADHYNNRVEEFKPVLSAGMLVGEQYVTSLEVPAPGSVAVDDSCSLNGKSGSECTSLYPSNGDVYVVGAREVREAPELEEEAKELREEAKQLKEEAVRLEKEAKQLTAAEKEAKERQAKERVAAAEKLREEEAEKLARAKEDERTGPKAKEREREEAEEIKAEAASPEIFCVYKFNSAGALISKLRRFHKKGEALEQGERHEFKELEHAPSVAVDPSGSLFVYLQQESGRIYGFDDASPSNASESIVQSGLAGEVKPGFAVDSEDDLYVGVGSTSEAGEMIAEEEGLEELPVVAKLEKTTGRPLIAELDLEQTTAVAVNPANEPENKVEELNDVYLDNVANVAGSDVTTVAAFNPEGKPIERFGAPGLKQGDGIAVDSKTGAVYVADATAGKVDVFELEQPGPPKIVSLSASVKNVTALKAQLNPAGASTEYYFEYGDGSCTAHPSPCTRTPDKVLDEGFEGFGEQPADEALPILATGVYRYRVVARNRFGTVRSAEQTFTIAASTSGLPDGRAWELVSPPEKDGAEPEAITQEGGDIQASEDGAAITYVADGPMPAKDEPEGSRNPEYTQVISTREVNGWVSQDISTANGVASGVEPGNVQEYQLFSANLSLGLLEPFTGGPKSSPLEEPPLSPPLSPGETQEKTIYLRDDAPLEPEAAATEDYDAARHNGELMSNAGYLALVTEQNAPGGAKFGGGRHAGLEPLGAAPDLTHVVFSSARAAPGLYEWGPKGAVQPVSLLPGETAPTAAAALGGPKSNDVRHAISNDGTLVVWTSGAHLYLRDTTRQETLKLDTAQPKASGAGEADAVFQTASADGSKVFFTDTQRLTSDAGAFTGAGVAKPDLYVFEVSGGNGPLSGTLTDLTPKSTNGESADVLVSEGQGGGVLGASEDGSYVYFVANGALAPGATRGGCPIEEFEEGAEGAPLPGTTCNLYVRHYDGTEWTPTQLIAALSYKDLPDWGGAGAPGDLAYMTSRVSPNGRYLAFMSDRSLTGYDNEDANGKAFDEEVFLYDASSERLVCASCNPTGQPPKGVDDLGVDGEAGTEAEGQGLLVDRLQIWSPANESADHWLAGSIPGWTPLEVERALYQSRYLTDSGRLFFNSPDHLVPAATGDKEKVYEYEPNGLGSCHSEAGCIGLISSGTSKHESAFLDASTSGNDAFFLTADRLAPQDVDGSFDVYDARVCEPSSPCLTSGEDTAPVCNQETVSCRASQSSVASFAAPASTTFSGPGNVVVKQETRPFHATSKHPTRAQLLAKALTACKRKTPRRKRVACESQARKKYGPRHHAQAKKGSSKGKGR